MMWAIRRLYSIMARCDAIDEISFGYLEDAVSVSAVRAAYVTFNILIFNNQQQSTFHHEHRSEQNNPTATIMKAVHRRLFFMEKMHERISLLR
jgi:hypothetical protein